MSVLRDSFLCDIQVRHNLDTGDQRLVDVSLQRHILQDHPVDPHPDLRLAVERLDMDIAGAALDRPLHKAVQQMDDP